LEEVEENEEGLASEETFDRIKEFVEEKEKSVVESLTLSIETHSKRV
jgi:hypothetical protein